MLTNSLLSSMESRREVEVGWGGGPGAPLTNLDDGGVQQKFIFYTKKNHNFRNLSTQKITTFLAYPQKSLSPFFTTQKNPSIFSRPKTIPASFIDPKNHFWPKCQTHKNHSDIPPPSPSLQYVGGAPGGIGRKRKRHSDICMYQHLFYGRYSGWIERFHR